MKITMDLTHTILLLAALVYSASAYSKYGRTCKDIGCRPSETCVISHDSCSWSQTEGKECGSYPTCKKSGVTNSSPGDGSDGAPAGTVTRKPYAPPPSSSGGDAPSGGGHLYPSIPNTPSAPSAPIAPSAPVAPFPNPSYPNPNPNPTYPNPNPSNGNRYPDPYGGNRNPSAPNPYDPYGNRDREPYGGRDPYDNKNKGDSGSSLGDIFGNFFKGGSSGGGGGSGGSGTRYGSGGSGGPGYSDIINALAGGGGNRGGSGGGLSDILSSFGNRGGSGGFGGGGSSSSGGGFSDILSSFGNRGSGGSGGFGGSSGGSGLTDILFGRGGASDTRDRYGGGNDYDNRRTQPQPQPQPSGGSGSGSGNGGFLSSLSSLFGQQLTDSLVRNALSGGNRGGSGSGGGSGGDFFNSLRYGGLFNENSGHGMSGDKPKVTVSGAGPGGYPTQAPYQPQSYSANNQSPNQSQNVQNYSRNNVAPQSQSGKPQQYGWSVGQN